MKIRIQTKRRDGGREKWFAWYPVRSAKAWHWLEYVERQMLLNDGKMKMFYFEVQP
jgi:hypothetical protein